MSKHYDRTAFDGAHHQHGAAPAPADLVRKFGTAHAPVGVFPLAKGGFVVIAVAFDPAYSLHPLAVVTRDGAEVALPVRGLQPSTRAGFVAEIMPVRPLRTRLDATMAAQHWVADVCDGLPATTRR